MGQAERTIIRQCFVRRRPLPDRIQNAPDLHMGLELYFGAFMELNTCRSTGWSAGPIPAWCIDEFCSRNELDSDEAEDMHYLIRQMDQEFLKYMERKSKNSS